MYKRINFEDKNDIYILYLYWLKFLFKVVWVCVWVLFIIVDGVFVFSWCMVIVNNWF